jgi:general secretion pathway protein E
MSALTSHSAGRYHDFLNALQKAGKLSKNDLRRLEHLKQSTDEAVPQLLVKLGLCSELDVADTMCVITGLDKVAAEQYPADNSLSFAISKRFLQQYHLVGLSETADEVVLAMMNPLDEFVLGAIRLLVDKAISVKVGLQSDIDKSIALQFGEQQSDKDELLNNEQNDEIDAEDLEHLKDLASEAPVIRRVNQVLQQAIELKASDIHIEPFEQSLKIRLRVDGVLQTLDDLPIASAPAILSRVKIMAKLDIAERRLPQDGRIKVQMLGKELDLRVSTIPTLYGESVVLRLLDKENIVLDFAALGFTGRHCEQFFSVLSQPHGIILITGPTGSGKSTTLYTALKQLNTAERKIITVEDPVEYQLEGINQIQVKPQIGLNFASALRSIVRQDPDVIMIGEMRDLETAQIAVQSALTGHLVLSTLHTNDAAGGITRLLDMGLEEYLISSTVNGILAQRLVRVLCPHCKKACPAPAKLVEECRQRGLIETPQSFDIYQAEGCDHCGRIGYRGRRAIIEFLPMSTRIKQQVMQHQQASVIQQQAIDEGMRTLYEDGLKKVIEGVTTLEEVLRVTSE